MKRRSFVKNISLASVAAPFVLKDIKFQAIQKKLFNVSKSAEDRVLILIRLNGGNDGLNTVIPRDMYGNLAIQRPNILIPEALVLPLTTETGLHPSMTGMKNMFDSGKVGIIQNVGYPEQNRSHFRSMDIWSTGSLDQAETRGWLGRQFDADYPNYPADYPNASYPDPFAISMGYDVSSTCQGLMSNFSHAVNDPFAAVNLMTSSVVNDGSYFGSHMEYIATLIDQTNAYGDQINAAANSGSTLSTLYDANNPIAVQLRYIAQMISGGLKTKVYILNINGFDTHNAQVDSTDLTQGTHASLLKTLSDAVSAFQDDLSLLGIETRVAGMTFSEFGRQIASNGSDGTDHGDAAPLFLFGSCVNPGILGPNPVIGNQIIDQAGVPMQIDFRDIYASVLKDWFEVSESEVQAIFDHVITFYQVLGSCNVGVDEQVMDKSDILVFPNPSLSSASLRISTESEWVKVSLLELDGKLISIVLDTNLQQGIHHISLDTRSLMPGQYIVIVQKESGFRTAKLQKIGQ